MTSDGVDVTKLAAWSRPGPLWDAMAQQWDWEEAPTHLETVNSSGLFSTVSVDKLSVKYSGEQQHDHDVGAVQANCAAPRRRLVYYFEMTVKNAGAKGQVAIGFTQKGFKMCRQPGWEPNSCGYHGVDGFIHRGLDKGDSFGPKFTMGDTIGAGINYASQEFFFTKNGELVGTPISKNIKPPIYPTVAVHSQNEEVSVNFGQHPFLFNIEAFELEERRKQQLVIEEMSLPVNLSHWIVRSYLLHYGYENTLQSFDTESKNALPPIPVVQGSSTNEQGDLYALNHRNVLRQLIRSGNIDDVFVKLQELYPQVLQNETSTLCFLLHLQGFIEYIRVRKLVEAVFYAKAKLTRFFSIEKFKPLVQDCMALLAYEDPSQSCVGHYLSMDQREVVADAVNMIVLSTNPDAKDSKNKVCSCLESLLRQLTVCYSQRQIILGHEGELFSLHKALPNTGNRGNF